MRFPKNAFLDKQLGIPHEEPPPDKVLLRQIRAFRERVEAQTPRGKPIRAPRRQVNAAVDKILGIAPGKEKPKPQMM